MVSPLIGGGIAAVVNTPINDGKGGATSASFSVDIEQIPGLIAKYEEAKQDLDMILLEAQELREIAPPGNDEVSKKLADSLGLMASDEPHKLSWVINQASDRLDNQIDQLKKALNEYKNADEAATPSQA